MVKIYGIPNCDTVRKAIKWLEAKDIEHEFIDYRKNGIERSTLESWDKAIGWEKLLNKSIKDNIDRDSAIDLMKDKVTLIKRPVLVKGSDVHLSFKPEQYESIFS